MSQKSDGNGNIATPGTSASPPSRFVMPVITSGSGVGSGVSVGQPATSAVSAVSVVSAVSGVRVASGRISSPP